MPIDWLWVVVIFLLAPGLLLLAAVVIGFGIDSLKRQPHEKGNDE
jgi:hypothetical protein